MKMRRRGFTLIEAMLYMAIFGGLTATAFPMLHRAIVTHRAVEDCADDVEAALRMARDLRADLRAGRGAGAWRQEPGAVVREEGGCLRRYAGQEGLSVSTEAGLTRVSWHLARRGGRRSGEPPAFEVAAGARP